MLLISVSRTLYKRQGLVEFKGTKTIRSRRRVAMTSKLSLFLRDYKQDRKWLGMPVGLDDLVFCSRDGRPLGHSSLSHEFHEIAGRIGLVKPYKRLKISASPAAQTAGQVTFVRIVGEQNTYV
jgi:hypothetical protein